MPEEMKLSPLPAFKPDLYERAWQSIPHPTLPLLATAHHKSVTVFSLSTLSAHSTLTGGHGRSVRSVAWKPNLGPQKLCLVSGSFDSTAGLWRWEGPSDGGANLETEVTAATSTNRLGAGSDDDDGDDVGGGPDFEYDAPLDDLDDLPPPEESPRSAKRSRRDQLSDVPEEAESRLGRLLRDALYEQVNQTLL